MTATTDKILAVLVNLGEPMPDDDRRTVKDLRAELEEAIAELRNDFDQAAESSPRPPDHEAIRPPYDPTPTDG